MKNVNFSTFWTSCFYNPGRRFFIVEYCKRHLAGLYCLKRKGWKMAIFGPKPWVTPLEKCLFFDDLNFLFLYSGKAFLRSRISLKRFSWPILPKKKSFKKRLFLDQNHGLTPLQKCQFFDFLNFLILYPTKEFFRSRIS